MGTIKGINGRDQVDRGDQEEMERMHGRAAKKDPNGPGCYNSVVSNPEPHSGVAVKWALEALLLIKLVDAMEFL